MTPVQNALLQANGVGDGLMQTLLLPAIAQGVESVHSQLQSAHDVGALRVVAKEVQNSPSFLQTRTCGQPACSTIVAYVTL